MDGDTDRDTVYDRSVSVAHVDLQKELISKCTREELASIGLAAPRRLPVPQRSQGSPRETLASMQVFINSFRYNHTPGYYFNIRKTRAFGLIMDTARDVIREALPIKCIEAVFLGLHVSCNCREFNRIPLGFKTVAFGRVYRHIVLAVQHEGTGRWGALGLSRKADLMDKPLEFDSLAALVTSYKQAYEGHGHVLLKLRIGLPADHDERSTQLVCWRCLNINTAKKAWPHVCSLIGEFTGQLAALRDRYLRTGECSYAQLCQTGQTMLTGGSRRHTVGEASPSPPPSSSLGSRSGSRSSSPLPGSPTFQRCGSIAGAGRPVDGDDDSSEDEDAQGDPEAFQQQQLVEDNARRRASENTVASDSEDEAHARRRRRPWQKSRRTASIRDRR